MSTGCLLVEWLESACRHGFGRLLSFLRGVFGICIGIGIGSGGCGCGGGSGGNSLGFGVVEVGEEASASFGGDVGFFEHGDEGVDAADPAVAFVVDLGCADAFGIVGAAEGFAFCEA